MNLGDHRQQLPYVVVFENQTSFHCSVLFVDCDDDDDGGDVDITLRHPLPL